jgi:AbrB family looped-hinge helix DNA binding protein
MLRLKSKVGPKGQAVIPKPVREHAGIAPGDEVYFRIEGDRIILEKKSGRELLQEFLDAVPQRMKRKDLRVDWDEMYRERLG